ncbi:MAG: DUF222 domain-containing protein, partial [Nocardioides sp.]
AEAHLLDAARTFGPRELRILARRVLDVVAPELGEDAERQALEAEEAHARRTTVLRTRPLGDGTTEIYARMPEPVATRLLTCLHAFTSPRQTGAVPKAERLPHDRKLGLAFCSLLETLDPARLPLHGGDATTVVVTIDLATLRDGLGVGHLGSEDVITAADARRLACSTGVIPRSCSAASPNPSTSAASGGSSAPPNAKPWRFATAFAERQDATSPPAGAKHTTPERRGHKAGGPTSATASSCATSITKEPTTRPTSTLNSPAVRFHRRR